MTDDDSERVWLPTEVVHRYLAGDRDFRRITIEGSEAEADLGFRGANLAEADFSHSWIDGIDFTGARLV